MPFTKPVNKTLTSNSATVPDGSYVIPVFPRLEQVDSDLSLVSSITYLVRINPLWTNNIWRGDDIGITYSEAFEYVGTEELAIHFTTLSDLITQVVNKYIGTSIDFEARD